MWSIFLEVTKSISAGGRESISDDMISDHGENFQIAEIIRESVSLSKINEEVRILLRSSWKRKKAIPAWAIGSSSWALLAKSILIGKQEHDSRHPSCSEDWRKFSKKVELSCHVRVEKNWHHPAASCISWVIWAGRRENNAGGSVRNPGGCEGVSEHDALLKVLCCEMAPCSVWAPVEFGRRTK